MHDIVERQTLELNGSDPAEFYGDTFVNCRIVLEDSTPARFFNCVFAGCNFEPDIPMDGNGFGIWQNVFHGCVINP